jgi:hypothetical protein
MTLQEAKDTFYEASATLSDNVRRLAFGGIAIIWILRVADKTAAGIPFSKVLFLPLIAFVVGLLLDALQYLYKTIAWWLYHKGKYQAGLAADAEIDPPMSLNAPTWFFFCGKVIACGIGYWYVLGYMWNALLAAPA